MTRLHTPRRLITWIVLADGSMTFPGQSTAKSLFMVTGQLLVFCIAATICWIVLLKFESDRWRQ
jgi:hypothetical protein